MTGRSYDSRLVICPETENPSFQDFIHRAAARNPLERKNEKQNRFK